MYRHPRYRIPPGPARRRAEAARGFLKLPHEEADALRFIQEWRDLAVFTSGASSFMLIFSEIATGPGRVPGVNPPDDTSFYTGWFEKYHASDIELLARV